MLLSEIIKNFFLKKTIIFLVHYPAGSDLKDGYFQRVKGVDGLLSGFNRVYIRYKKSFSGNILKPGVSKIDKNIYEIVIYKKNPFHMIYLLCLVLIIGRIYFHSIYRLKSFFHKLLYLLSRKKIIDIHGAVPEEIKLSGNIDSYKKFNGIEEFAVRKASIIIGVTKRMASHIRKKYNLKNKILILPILQENKKQKFRKKRFQGNSVIYCGGMQEWQQVDKMLKFVNNNKKNKIKSTFLVTDPKKLLKKYRDKFREDFPGTVTSVKSHEVKRWYKKNSFGLILRKDNIINNVAFPTKLIEYIRNNIVPIVDSPNIGDFSDMGYSSVFYKGEIPQKKEWERMVERNQRILEEMYDKTKREIKFFADSMQ